MSKDIASFVFVNANQKPEFDEIEFANYFAAKYKLYFFANKFYGPYGSIEEIIISKKIQEEIMPFTKKPSLYVDKLLKTLKRSIGINEIKIQDNLINCLNTSLVVTNKGLVEEKNPSNFVIKFRFNYNKNIKKPTTWISFLKDLLEDEDIVVLQKFMGYCLTPSTKLQQALFIIGQGGEGKSRIGLVMEAIWSNFIIKSKLHKIEQDRFVTATLVNALVFLDDDLSGAKIEDTGILKELISNEGSFFVEQKGKDLSRAKVFTKFMGFGNNILESVNDLSEGWFRRFKFISCKQKTRQTNDVDLIKKLYEELESIFMWCLEGLEMLIKDNWQLGDTASSRACMLELKKEIWTIGNFFYSTLEVNETNSISSKDLTDKYVAYCIDNELMPLPRQTFISEFNKYIKNSADINSKIKRSNHINDGSYGSQCRGYKGVGLKRYKPSKGNSLD